MPGHGPPDWGMAGGTGGSGGLGGLGWGMAGRGMVDHGAPDWGTPGWGGGNQGPCALVDGGGWPSWGLATPSWLGAPGSTMTITERAPASGPVMAWPCGCSGRRP